MKLQTLSTTAILVLSVVSAAPIDRPSDCTPFGVVCNSGPAKSPAPPMVAREKIPVDETQNGFHGVLPPVDSYHGHPGVESVHPIDEAQDGFHGVLPPSGLLGDISASSALLLPLPGLFGDPTPVDQSQEGRNGVLPSFDLPDGLPMVEQARPIDQTQNGFHGVLPPSDPLPVQAVSPSSIQAPPVVTMFPAVHSGSRFNIPPPGRPARPTPARPAPPPRSDS